MKLEENVLETRGEWNMSAFIGLIILALLSVISMLLFALNLRDAIKDFKEGAYFRFGVDVILTIIFFVHTLRLWFM